MIGKLTVVLCFFSFVFSLKGTVITRDLQKDKYLSSSDPLMFLRSIFSVSLH